MRRIASKESSGCANCASVIARKQLATPTAASSLSVTNASSSSGSAFLDHDFARMSIFAPDTSQIHAAARSGTSGAGGPLPHIATVQRAFGRYDLSSVRAHTDADSKDAALSMNAEAYSFADHIAFAFAPSLHTVAHEAAHAIQQRASGQRDGVSRPGDFEERHADAVADVVAAGGSAEALLNSYPGVRATPPRVGIQSARVLRKPQDGSLEDTAGLAQTPGEQSDMGASPGMIERLLGWAGIGTADFFNGLFAYLGIPDYDLAADFLRHYVSGRGVDFSFDVPREWQIAIAHNYRKPGKYKDVSTYSWGMGDLKNALGHFNLEITQDVSGDKVYTITDHYTFPFKAKDKKQMMRHGFEVPATPKSAAMLNQYVLPSTPYQNPGGFSERWEIKQINKKWILFIPQQFLADHGVDFDVRAQFTIYAKDTTLLKDHWLMPVPMSERGVTRGDVDQE